MAVRKVNHSRRIRSKTSTQISKSKFKDIIEFKYNSKDIYDKKPMVFVLNKKGKVLNGINIGYLKEFIVEKLLEEKNSKKLRSWPLCEKAFRTYKISNTSMVELIKYETAAQRKKRLEEELKKEEKKKEKEMKNNENKL